MSPKTDNQDPSVGPDVTVDIPHEPDQTPPVPTAAPPLPEFEPLPVRPINITDNVPPSPPVVPDMPPALQHEFHEHEGRHWPVIVMYTGLAFLVALLVVFAGRWVYRKTTHQPAKTTKPEAAESSKLPVATPSGSQQPSSGGTTSSPAPGASQSQKPSQLPNNGPGDVVAIFVGAALVAGGLHFLYTLRRQN